MANKTLWWNSIFAHYVDVQIDCRVSINILLSTEAAYQESANHHYMKHGLVSVILLHVILAFRKKWETGINMSASAIWCCFVTFKDIAILLQFLGQITSATQGYVLIMSICVSLFVYNLTFFFTFTLISRNP